MCRFLPPPGRQQFGSQNLRCLVFFEIRIFLQKVVFFSIFQIRMGIWKFTASGTASNWHQESPRYLVFFEIRIFFCKKLKSFYFSKFVLVFGNLPPPGRQQCGSQNLRCLVFFDIRIFFKKLKKYFQNFSGMWKFAVSGTASNWHCESAPSPLFGNSIFFCKNSNMCIFQ